MNDLNLKALYFCHTHTNLFSQKKCKSCRRGMCHTCIHNNPDYCDSCLKAEYRSGDIYESKREILTTLSASVIITLVFHIYQYYSIPEVYNSNFLINLGLVFLYSISIIGTYYMLNNTSLLKDINSIPFIGFKLSIVALVLIVASCIPVLYFLYNFLIALRTNKKSN